MQRHYQHALPVGTRLESYEIQDVLGAGGFGITYKAFDHTLQCSVAIKEYLPSVFAVRTPDGTTVSPKSERDEESYEYGLKRFLDEARTLALFREANIVRVVRFLEANQTAYLVMDYEEGESLSARLKRQNSLDEAQVLETMIPILESLRHAKNFLHRDIKPSNIYRRHDGSPVLLDFGSARLALNQQSQALTGMVTPGYAPIEQHFSESRQGPWTDIYALGATTYHCAIGIAPVVATERMAAIQDGEPDPVDNIRDLLEERFSAPFLEAMVWMLRPAAKDRPQTVDEILSVLYECSDTQPGNGTRPRRPAPVNHAADQATELATPVWQEGTLDALEATLQHYIGPIAKVLIRKASTRTSSVDELTQLLSTFLTTDEHKTAFLEKTRLLTRRLPEAAAPTPSGPVSVPTSKNSHLTGNDRFSSEQLKQAEVRLAEFMGPLARVLVKQAATRAVSLEELYRVLAGELPDDRQRQAFLASDEASGRRH